VTDGTSASGQELMIEADDGLLEDVVKKAVKACRIESNRLPDQALNCGGKMS
jgi:hypothetical protein